MIRILSCLALSAISVWAELLPTWSPHQMCAEAAAIVTGERVGANRVAVREWILSPSDGRKVRSVINIAGLDKHDRMIGTRPDGSDREQGRRLKSQRLLCFLEEKSDGWRAMAAAGQGSSGLVWIERGKCYRYEQWKNPGPHVLLPSREYQTEEALRLAVGNGLADREVWERTQKIPHPQEKAIVFCSYLLERTSPEGAHGTYRSRVRRVLPKLGEQAVAELVVLLENAIPGDRLDDTVLILYDLGSAAKPAVPHLVALLQQPGYVHPVRLIEALGRIGDATVAQQLLPYLDRELRVRAEVAGAMARFSYQDSVPLIAKALPEPNAVEDGEAYHVYAMLRALHELGAEETSRLARTYLEIPAMRHVRNLLEPFLDNEDRGGQEAAKRPAWKNK